MGRDLPRLCTLFEGLAAYERGVPVQTVRFSRNPALLAEVRRVSQQREREALALLAALRELAG